MSSLTKLTGLIFATFLLINSILGINIVENTQAAQGNPFFYGSITDNETGDPISNAVINAYCIKGANEGVETSTTTDLSGNYILYVTIGIFYVNATAEGYQKKSVQSAIKEGEKINMNFNLDIETQNNYNPVISNENPIDNSNDISIDLTQLSAYVEDPDGDSINWTIETIPNIGSNFDTDSPNCTATCSISNLQSDTTYTWFVNATDGDETTKAIYSFTTETIQTETITLINESFELGIPVNWDNSGWIENYYGSPHSGSGWIFSWAAGDTLTTPTVTFGEDTELSFWYAAETMPLPKTLEIYLDSNLIWTDTFTHTSYQQAVIDLSGYTGEHTISFKAMTSDMYGQILDDILLTTIAEAIPNRAPVISDESPTNNSNDVLISTSSLEVDITDADGDTISWSIETVPDIGSNSSVSNNIRAICEIDVPSLEYNTTYTWFVNATDGEKTTKAIYSFTTEDEIIPNIPPIADFTFLPINPTTDDTIQFSDNSSDGDGTIASWLWDFGDGDHSSEQNPSHQYSIAGQYSVNLTVTDNNGDTDYEITVISVTEEAAQLELIVVAPSEVNEGNSFTVNVSDDTGASVICAEVTFDGVTNLTGPLGEATFTAPDVETNTTFNIIAEKDGYISNDTSILVIKNETTEPVDTDGDGIPDTEDNDDDNDGWTDDQENTYGTDPLNPNDYPTDTEDPLGRIYVDDDASPEWYDRYHVKTIQEGADNASENDTVYVFDGYYNELVYIEKSIKLIANSTDTVTVDGTGFEGQPYGITVTKKNTLIKNFTIRDCGRGVRVAYQFNPVYNVTIESNLIYNMSYYGISTDGVEDISIIGNIIYNSTTGINSICSDNFYISDNIVFENEHHGIHLQYTNDSIITSNYVFLNNDIGIAVAFLSSNNTIYNNNITDNTHNGLGNGLNSWNISKTTGTNIIGGTYLGGNYWGDYYGEDQNYDGIGDTPYQLFGENNYDYLPLVEQVIDDEPPVVVIESPENGSVVYDPDITVSGYAIDNIGIISISYSHSYENQGESESPGSGYPAGYFPDAVEYWSFEKEFTLQPGENIVKVTATDEAGNSGNDSITLIYRPTVIFGYINDSETLLPIEDSKVVLFLIKSEGSTDLEYTYTNESGFYSINLKNEYLLIIITARKEGYYANTTARCIFFMGQTYSVNFYLKPGRADESSILKGNITDELTNEPIENATVMMTHGNISDSSTLVDINFTKSNSDGLYLMNLTPGDINVTVFAQNYYPWQNNETIHIDAYNTSWLNISMIYSKVTNLEVKDKKDGKLTLSWDPLSENAEVEFYNIYDSSNLGEPIATTQGTSYTITGLSVGKEYTFQVSANSSVYGEGTLSDPESCTSEATKYTTSTSTPPPPLDNNDNNVPQADASNSQIYGFIGEEISFDASLSSDSDNDELSYSWDFGDENTGEGIITNHVYSQIGVYTVKLTVDDQNGGTDTDEIEVTISKPNNPPASPIVSGPEEGNVDIIYEFTVISSDEENDQAKYVFDWDDGTKTVTDYYNSGKEVTVEHSWTEPGEYKIKIQSTDTNDAPSKITYLTIMINVYKVDGVIKGYLIDSDNNGLYDKFYNEETGKKSEITTSDKEGEYLIDEDSDSKAEYVVDTLNNDVRVVIEEEIQEKSIFSLEQILIISVFSIIVALIAILFILFLRRKKEETQKV